MLATVVVVLFLKPGCVEQWQEPGLTVCQTVSSNLALAVSLLCDLGQATSYL